MRIDSTVIEIVTRPQVEPLSHRQRDMQHRLFAIVKSIYHCAETIATQYGAATAEYSLLQSKINNFLSAITPKDLMTMFGLRITQGSAAFYLPPAINVLTRSLAETHADYGRVNDITVGGRALGERLNVQTRRCMCECFIEQDCMCKPPRACQHSDNQYNFPIGC